MKDETEHWSVFRSTSGLATKMESWCATEMGVVTVAWLGWSLEIGWERRLAVGLADSTESWLDFRLAKGLECRWANEMGASTAKQLVSSSDLQWEGTLAVDLVDSTGPHLATKMASCSAIEMATERAKMSDLCWEGRLAVDSAGSTELRTGFHLALK